MASDLRFLQSLIDRCDIHALRMNTACKLMANNMNQAIIGAQELFCYWNDVREKIVKIQEQWQQESADSSML